MVKTMLKPIGQRQISQRVGIKTDHDLILPIATVFKSPVLKSPLGWIGVVARDERLIRLSFGYRTKGELCKTLQIDREMLAGDSYLLQKVTDRLLSYAEGENVDFADIEIDESHLTPFARRVSRHCRNIQYGQTLTYGQLAKKAGSPSAARAAGSVMSKNRYPLVVPCHRVVAANRQLGGFSAPGGTDVKRNLLSMESGEE